MVGRRAGFVLLFVAVVASTAGVVAAADSFDLEYSVPSDVETGESTAITATVSLDDLPSVDSESTATVDLSVDGTHVDSDELTVAPGDSDSIAFTHAFAEAGPATIELAATVAFPFGNETESITFTIDVSDPGDADGSSDLVTPDSVDPDAVSTETVAGAALPVRERTEREYLEAQSVYTEDLSVEPRTGAYVLMSANETTIVFADDVPDPSTGSVTGYAAPTDEDGVRVLFETDRSLSIEPQPVTLSELLADPSEYRYRAVRVTGTYRQLAFATDAAEGTSARKRSGGRSRRGGSSRAGSRTGWDRRPGGPRSISPGPNRVTNRSRN